MTCQQGNWEGRQGVTPCTFPSGIESSSGVRVEPLVRIERCYRLLYVGTSKPENLSGLLVPSDSIKIPRFRWGCPRAPLNLTMSKLGGYAALPTSDLTSSPTTLVLHYTQPQRSSPHLIFRMANRGYDVVVDVDAEVKASSPSLAPGGNLKLTPTTAGRFRPHRPATRRP